MSRLADAERLRRGRFDAGTGSAPADRVEYGAMSTRTPTVLLVDQDDAWREALADVLRTECRVLRAASGETALGMLTREEVDVLLVDLASRASRRSRRCASRERTST